MRFETKKAYEKRIAELEKDLDDEKARSHRHYTQSKMNEKAYLDLKDAKWRTIRAREWSVKQAINAHQVDIVAAARQILDFVYGPDESEE